MYNYLFKSPLLKRACILVLFSLTFFCNSPQHNNTASKKGLNIHYVNLNIIFDYMVNLNPEFKQVKSRRENLKKSIDDINDQLKSSGGSPKPDLIKKLNNYKSEIRDISGKEEIYKSRILNEIENAVGDVAKKSGIDYILNIGEGAVYARKEYDITEEVLQVIYKRKKRSSPVSR